MMAIVAAACGGGGSDDSSGSTQTGETRVAQEITTPSAGEGSTAETDPNATLRFSYQVAPTSWDPARMSSSFDTPTAFLIYDRLVHLTPNAELAPGLAESWEFSDDGSSLTMILRQGVTFHDGTPFNAEAARLNLERNKAGASAGELAAVETITAVDEYTLELTFNAAAGSVPGALSDRAGVMASPAAFATEAAAAQLDLNPVGAGMYRMVEYTKDQRIRAERFEGYWEPEAQGAAAVEALILTDNNARANALKSGDVDLANLEPCQVDDLEASGFTVNKGLSLNLHHLQLNRSRPFLDVKEVRQAISMAVNRELLVEAALCGYGAPAVQNFPAGYWAHNDELGLDRYAYDPDQARQMLQAAGVPEGHTIDTVVPNLPVYLTLAQAMKDQLLAVGLNLEIRPVDPVQTAPIFYVQQSGDALISVFGGRADPAQLLGSLFTAGPIQNPGGHTTPAVTELVAAANAPGDQTERAGAQQAASAEILEEALNTVVYHTMVPLAYSDNVVGVQSWLGGKPELRGVGIAAS